MSEYNEFLAERDKIDVYLQKGYKIKTVTENLSGAFVTFVSHDQTEEEVLHVLTADGRKYFSTFLLQRQ
ncbi:hypothetical protein [Priestia koreensis]|uniref:hypothetical protein n=1 Tax=Priestia koreensis TaxID=284581 RepID=UPI001F5A8930|nr:hypothetical protein [Priestia koreensis]MCM3002385.1 hypothetical protein [Priestia koreensis]UNL84109.1 hypothetical protein IE339_18415 [Priestia koreensis]